MGVNDTFSLNGGYNITYLEGNHYFAPWAERSFCYIMVVQGNHSEIIPVMNWTIVDNYKIVFTEIGQTGQGSSRVDVWLYNVEDYGDYWGRNNG